MAPIINGNNGNNGNNDDNGAPKKTSTGANGGTSKASGTQGKSVRGGRAIDRRNSDLGTSQPIGPKKRGGLDGIFGTTDDVDPKKPSQADKLAMELDQARGAWKDGPRTPIENLDMEHVKIVHENSVKDKKKDYENKEKEQRESNRKSFIEPDKDKTDKTKDMLSQNVVRLGQEHGSTDLGSLYAGASSKDKTLERNKIQLEGKNSQNKDGIVRKGTVSDNGHSVNKSELSSVTSFMPGGASEKPRVVDYVNKNADNKFSKFRSGGSAGGYNIGNPQEEWKAKKEAKARAEAEAKSSSSSSASSASSITPPAQRQPAPVPPTPVAAVMVPTKKPDNVFKASVEDVASPGPLQSTTTVQPTPPPVILPPPVMTSEQVVITKPKREVANSEDVTGLGTRHTTTPAQPVYELPSIQEPAAPAPAPSTPPPAVIVSKKDEDDKKPKKSKSKKKNIEHKSRAGYIVYQFPLLVMSSVEIAHKQNRHALCIFDIDLYLSDKGDLGKFIKKYTSSVNLDLTISSPDGIDILFEGTFMKFNMSGINTVDGVSEPASTMKVYIVSNSIKYDHDKQTLINVFLDSTLPDTIAGLGLTGVDIKLNLEQSSQDPSKLTKTSLAGDNYHDILAIGCCYDENIWEFIRRQGMFFSKSIIARYSGENTHIEFGVLTDEITPIYLNSESSLGTQSSSSVIGDCIEAFTFSLSNSVMYGKNVIIRNGSLSLSFGNFFAFETKDILTVGSVIVIDRSFMQLNDLRTDSSMVVEGVVSYVNVYTEPGTNVVKCFAHIIMCNKGFQNVLYPSSLDPAEFFPYESIEMVDFDLEVNSKVIKTFHSIYFKGIIRYFDIVDNGINRRLPVVLPIDRGIIDNNKTEREYMGFKLVLPHTVEEDTSHTLYPPNNSLVLANLAVDSTSGFIHSSLDPINIRHDDSGEDITEYSVINKESSVTYDGSFKINKQSINQQGQVVPGAIFESKDGEIYMEADEINFLSDTKIYVRAETDLNVHGDDLIVVNKGVYNQNNRSLGGVIKVLDIDNNGVVTKDGISKT